MTFLGIQLESCGYQRVEIYVGGMNMSEADLAVTVCEGSVPGPEFYHASTFHVFWKMDDPKDGFIVREVIGFRLQFSFHERTSPLLQKLPSGLWNCSVPQWPEFKSHFHCNYDTECVAAEDETDCPFTGHCPPEHVTANGRCYRYINPRGPLSWLEANIVCSELYGGYLASFNSPEEWSGVTSAFSLKKSHIIFFVGLRSADSGKPHIGDCMDSSDEDFCDFPACIDGKEMPCGGGKQCIPRQKVCNGPIECVDASDEQNCARNSNYIRYTASPPALVWTRWTEYYDMTYNIITVRKHSGPCPEGFFKCAVDSYCFDVLFRCNGVRDCPGGEDEAGCAEYSCPGMYRCRGSTVCYRAPKLCDGFGDCPQQDDELFCDLQCPANCTCYGLAFTCPLVFYVTEFPDLRYLDASDSGLTPQQVNHSILLIHLSFARCGLLHLGNLTLPNLRSLELSGNNLSAVSVHEVNRLQNLKELILADNPLMSVFLTEKQTSLNLHYLDLSLVRMPSLTVRTQLPFLQFLNLSFTGLDQLQGTGFQSLSSLRVIDLHGCPMTHFPRHIFRDLQQLRTVYSGSYRLCCQATLPSGFNLKNCHTSENNVSSCDRLMKYDTHAVLVAVFAAVSIIGNASGFAVRVIFKRTRAKSAQDVFLCHLCISDFAMGVYLAIVGLTDRLYQGTYLWEDVAWRQSVTCKTAGILFTVSSQVSSLFVFIITVQHVAFLSFHSNGFGSNPLTLYAVSSVVWILGVVSSVAPLFTSHWRNSAETAICIPLIYTERDNSSFVDLLVIPQCTLHVGVMAAQVYIFLKTRPDPLVVLKADSVPSQICDARQFLPVAVCSCLCRLSLLVLAVSLYEGSITSNPARVAASVLVLPLSSALHPVLYAFGAVQERRQAARNERLLKYLMAKRRAKVRDVK
ncbi:G-protein coupled receptor GRL101-like [Littorina saxatilis]|uniref:G-protein coupled receptor GRL101-like n=1 Tax=Littorina saxatilis TaxID=31220 RepID=UPI0038B5134A